MIIRPLGLLLLLLSLASLAACARPEPASSPTTTSAKVTKGSLADRSIYRLDFVLTDAAPGAAPVTTSFTLTLPELETGEVMVGENVSLTPPSGPPLRQDVGTRVKAIVRSVGNDVLVEAHVEMSASDLPTSVRKLTSVGSAFASSGKPALVAKLDDPHRRVELTVTPTKVR